MARTTTTPDGDRIAKIIARAGLASRRAAEAMIAEGRVRVNGRRVASPALNVTDRDRVEVDGAPLPEAEGPRLWLYHKPQGLVTSAADEKGRETVFDALPADMPRVLSVGRLDLVSEGLLLLTNDGAVKRRLELPSTGWVRRYRVRVHGAPDDAILAPVRQGIEVDGERFQPMQVDVDRQQGANAWLTIALREGRNREIRRALAAVGLTVSRLIRTAYGPFQLGDLAQGAVREVRPRVVRDQLGLDETPARATKGPAGRDKAPAPKAGGRSAPADSADVGRGKAAGKRKADERGRPTGAAETRGPKVSSGRPDPTAGPKGDRKGTAPSRSSRAGPGSPGRSAAPDRSGTKGPGRGKGSPRGASKPPAGRR